MNVFNLAVISWKHQWMWRSEEEHQFVLAVKSSASIQTQAWAKKQTFFSRGIHLEYVLICLGKPFVCSKDLQRIGVVKKTLPLNDFPIIYWQIWPCHHEVLANALWSERVGVHVCTHTPLIFNVDHTRQAGWIPSHLSNYGSWCLVMFVHYLERREREGKTKRKMVLICAAVWALMHLTRRTL